MNRATPFKLNRLMSFAGYTLPPVVLDAMLFYLPCFVLCAYRVVECFSRVWEVWSPNDRRSVFYPGVRNTNIKLGLSLPPGMRRYDGHLGRFDPTVSPQAYDKNKPWLGFILAISDSSLPESTPFPKIWIHDKTIGHHRIDSCFLLHLSRRVQTLLERINECSALRNVRPDLWDSRPSKPDKEDVMNLGRIISFEEAVDNYAAVQRGVKILAAWLRMAVAYFLHPPTACSPLERVPPADETLMGVWLNGCEEEEGIWLMANRVPCYIIHEVDPARENPTVSGAIRFSDFVTDTPALFLGPSVNPLDQLARKNGNDWLNLQEEIGQAVPELLVYLRSDREKSSPYAQGWRNAAYINPLPAFRISRISVRNVTEEPDEAMDPPPVTGDNSGNKWHDWAEEEIDDDESAYFQQGKRYQATEESIVYYDRINARRLYLDYPLKAPPGYRANPSIYGIPFPKAQFLEKLRDGTFKTLDATTWVYFERVQKAGDLARCYNPELPEDQYDGLPLPGWSEEEQAERNGHGTVSENDDDLDKVSIPSDDYIPYERPVVGNDSPSLNPSVTPSACRSSSPVTRPYRNSPSPRSAPQISPPKRWYSSRLNSEVVRARDTRPIQRNERYYRLEQREFPRQTPPSRRYSPPPRRY
ncbi:hypothetical protein CPC08DRAFT_728886 [Agrocybe pediades]|nr:hypothetical protein CPC08DRAFT_728886 [Agrocybe pediades]